MGYMGDVFYATEVASPGGASVLTVDELQSAASYAIEMASPGASTSVADGYHKVLLYAAEFAFPRSSAMFGAATLVADKKLIDYFYATEVASPRRK